MQFIWQIRLLGILFVFCVHVGRIIPCNLALQPDLRRNDKEIYSMNQD